MLKTRIKRLRILSTILLVGIIVNYAFPPRGVHIDFQLLRLEFMIGYYDTLYAKELQLSSLFLGYIVSLIGSLYSIKLLGKSKYFILPIIFSLLGILTYLNEISRLFYDHFQFIFLLPFVQVIIDWLSYRALKDIEEDEEYKTSWWKSIFWVFVSFVSFFILMTLIVFIIDYNKPKAGEETSLVEKYIKATEYYEQGDYHKAIDAYSLIVNRLNRAKKCEVNLRIANSYRVLEMPDKAIVFHKKALEFSDDKHTKAVIYNDLALVYTMKKNSSKAEKLYMKSLELQPNSENNAQTYNNMAMLYMNKKEYGKTMELMQKSLNILEKSANKDNEKIAQVYKNIGVIFLIQKDIKKAFESYQKALDISLANKGENHPLTLEIYHTIAQAEGEYLRHPKKSIELYLENIQRATKMYGERHPFVAKSYYELGRVYAFFLPMGNQDKAMKYFNKALDIYREFYNNNHPLIRKVLEDVKRCER